MYYHDFHGQAISALGFGVLRLPMSQADPKQVDRPAAQAVLDAAIAAGVNYFDTAYTYLNGDSERFLGEALEKYPRESYFLATKFYVKAGEDIEAMFEEQLRRLRTDYVDFYLLHGLDENTFGPYTDRERDYLGYILRQREKGRVRYIGFSSHATPETLGRFLDLYDGYDMALLQLNYLDWGLLKAEEQYRILARHGIPAWVMEPLKGGRLSTLNPAARDILQRAAPGRSISSWGFRFLMGLQNVHTVLSGMSTVEQVQDNAATFAAPDPLTQGEARALQQAADAFFDDLGAPCSACRYCCDTCPAGLDIPLLIQGYNERRISGEAWRLVPFEQTKGAAACIGCGACRSHCPQHIDIPKIMAELAAPPQ